MTDLPAAYLDGARRIADLVRDLDEVALATPVPSCPGWSVRDVVCHLTGVASDANGDRMPSSPEDREWTANHLASRRDVPLADVLGEWEREQPGVARQVAAGANHFAFDVVTHEQDIRGALKQPGERDGALLLTQDAAIGVFGRRVVEAGLPAVGIATEHGLLVAGEGEPGITVQVPRYELLRAASGRRSAAQIAGWAWSGDSSRYVPLLPFLPMAGSDLVDD